MEEVQGSFDLLTFSTSDFNTQPLFSKQTDQIHHFDEFLSSSPKQIPNAKFWQLKYYMPYFDVDSSTVFRRLYRALLPFRTDSLFEDSMPDLYAPFWIATTLILLFSISGSITGISSAHPWVDSCYKLVEGACFIYGYLVGVPLVLYCTLNNSGNDTGFIEVISIFGYSMSSYLIGGLCCIAPIDWVKWISMIVSACNGVYLVGSYLLKQMNSNIDKSRVYFMMIVACVGHLGMIYLGCVYFNIN